MAWLGQLSPGSTYLSGVLGPMLLLGAGLGIAFVPLTMTSLAGVAPQDSGAAASMVNVTQQVGGALGLAILVTVFGSASRSAARHPLAHAGPVAQLHHVLTHGMTVAFTVAAGFDLIALLVVGAILKPDTFPTSDNLRAIFTQSSVVGVIAIGMTLVIATSGIDLSVGSIVAAAGIAALDFMTSPAGEKRRQNLRTNLAHFAEEMPRLFADGRKLHSAIISIVLGRAEAALEGAQLLADKGFFVPAIRYPTVPRDSARLRLTISARHTKKQISGLCAVLRNMVT